MTAMAASTRPTRPARSAPARTRGRAVPQPGGPDVGTVVVRTVATAVLAAVIGLAIATILAVSAWALAPHVASGGAEASARFAVLGWLFAHHVTIDVGHGTLSLTPLGMVLVPLSLCYASGRQLARSLQPVDLGAAGRILGLFALAYGVLVALAAGLSRTDVVQPHALGAFVAGAVIAASAAGLGLVRAADLTHELGERTPPTLRQALAGASAALAAMVGTGALVLALLLTISFPEALEITRALHADLLGGILVALLGVALLPNLALWVLAFTTGVGFHLGVDAPVTPQVVSYGPLPVLPPLAAVPPEGHLPSWALVVLVIPLLAGGVSGLVVHRRCQGLSAERVAGTAALGGLLAGAALGVLGWLSSGALGAQQLAAVGPVGWQVGLVAAMELSVAAAAVAFEAHRRGWNGELRLPDVRRLLPRSSTSGTDD